MKTPRPDHVKIVKRISVTHVWCHYFTPGHAQREFAEPVIAFGITSSGDLVGITLDFEGKEDYCERQEPQYELQYTGNPK